MTTQTDLGRTAGRVETVDSGPHNPLGLQLCSDDPGYPFGVIPTGDGGLVEVVVP
jgi:hypothetical protein